MPLSDEQRTMMQLLLGGQSYDDIAGLLGIPREDVQTRVRAALAEMGGSEPDAGLADYLLGQADPIGRADAVRQLQNDPAANDLASRLVSQLRLLAPSAQLPEVPEPRGGRGAAPPPVPPPAGPSAPPPPGGAPQPQPPAATPNEGKALPGRLAARAGGLTSRVGGDRRLLAGVGAAAVLILLVVVAITVLGGDGDDDSSGGAPADDEVTAVTLSPLTEGSSAAGQAAFGQVGNNQPALRINIAGLAPTDKDQSYIIWLYNTDQLAFPLGRNQVGANGNLRGDAVIPQAIIPLLSQFGCVDVSLASVAETTKALKDAVKGRSLPAHTGESVLRGQIPRPDQEAGTGADSDCTAAAEAAAAAAQTQTQGGATPTAP